MMKSLNSHFICDWQSVKIANSGNFPLRTILGYVLDASFKDLSIFVKGLGGVAHFVVILEVGC